MFGLYKLMRGVLVLVIIVALPVTTYCFELSVPESPGWLEKEATFHTSPLSTAGSGLTSNQLASAFLTALSRWNSGTAFTYRATPGSANPCAIPGSSNPANNANGYTFASTSCGDVFGGSTLAVATTWRQGSNGDGEIIQSGIVFNSARSWSIYSGSSGTGFDFTRVATHELGHSLGLAHTTASPSIMQANIGDIEVPQSDDKNGVRAIYGALSIVISPILFLLLD